MFFMKTGHEFNCCVFISRECIYSEGKIATKREYNDIQMYMYVNYAVHKICDKVTDAA